jgi:uncharacterized protein YndB with AHSA1/START domain
MSSDVVTVERVIPAPAEKVFALLADPSRHQDIDGSGTVREAHGEPQQLQLGDEFGMAMHWFVPYATKNRVIELEPDRRIAWQTLADYPVVSSLVTGRVWRYELEPVEGGTLVRESWDISQEKPLSRPFVRRLAGQTRDNMTRTLERIEQVLSA